MADQVWPNAFKARIAAATTFHFRSAVKKGWARLYYISVYLTAAAVLISAAGVARMEPYNRNT